MSNILLMGFFAALVAILATIAIERFGGRLGGLLSSLPSTVVPASFGFWVTAESWAAFEAAIFTVPLGMAVNALFLYSWRILPPLFSKKHSLVVQLTTMIVASLSLWAVGAFALVYVLSIVEDISVWGTLAAVLLVLFGLFACRGNPPAPKGAKKISVVTVLSRGILAGVAIGFSVFLSSLGSPILAGMASVFPAIFLTTMVSIWVSQGESVQLGAVGPMILGSSSVAFYAVFASLFYPLLGVFLGGITTWLSSVLLISLPAWFYLRHQSERG